MLKEHLLEFLNDIHWNTLYNLKINEDDSLRHLIEAYVDMKTWIIHFTFHKNFPDIFQNLLEKDQFATSEEKPHLLCKNSKNLNDLIDKYSYSPQFHILLRDLIGAIAYHEYGHSKECPISHENFSVILQAISTVLEQEKKFNQKTLQYIINLFTDIIVNTSIGLQADKNFFRNGFFMLYYSEILLYGSKDLAFNYFLLLNTKLFQFYMPIRQKFEDMIIINMPTNYSDKLKEMLEIIRIN